MLRLTPGDRRSVRDGQAILRTFLDGETKAAAETLHILHRVFAPDLHLVVGPDCSPDDPLEARIRISRDGLDRLAALDRLLRHLLGYKVPPDRRMTAQQRRRFKAMLRAADGLEHRASQREIADVMFGVARVAGEHWQTSPLRDIVKDLLKDGAEMIGGDYLKLLRFRRRL